MDTEDNDEYSRPKEDDHIGKINERAPTDNSQELCQKIFEWLEPTRYDEDGGEFRRHMAAHVPGTNGWIFKTDEWNRWYHGADQGLLWIKGIPGAGKSVIAAHLTKQLSRNHDAVVLYFFFRQIIDANHTPQSLLRDYLAQLLTSSPSLQSELSEFVRTRKVLADISTQDFWRLLRLGLSHQDRVYLIADALDEMDDGNDDFIEQLAQLGHHAPSRIKVFLTSRPTPAIETALRYTASLKIRLDVNLVDVDIAAYVSHCLLSSSVSPSDQTLIHQSIPGHANGLFLYARLAMDRLIKPGVDVPATLRSIPQTLNAMFTMLLLEHAERSGISLEFQLIVLRWVTHASRPLRLLELSDIIHVVFGKQRGYTLKDIKSHVRTSCGPLIEVLPDETLSVVHHSLTEFLKGWTRDSEPIASAQRTFPVLEMGSTHLVLAKECMEYLSPESLHDKRAVDSLDEEYCPSDSQFQPLKFNVDHPFAKYAIANWAVHSSKAISGGVSDEEEQTFYQSIRNFLKAVRENTVLGRVVPPALGIRAAQDLHVFVLLGLPRFVATIIDADSSRLDQRTLEGNTPLHLAAQAGQREIVDLLLNRGAEPNAERRDHERPIHLAAARGHGQIIRALLAAGVDPLTTVDREQQRWGNDPPMVSKTALAYACEGRHLDALDAFIPYLTPAGRAEALARAAMSGFSAAVDRLLGLPDFQVDARFCGETPLLLACRGRHYDVIQSLLKARADPNARGSRDLYLVTDEDFLHHLQCDDAKPERCYTPIHAFASALARYVTRSEPVTEASEADAVTSTMMAILQAGGKVDIQDLVGDTPLHHACAEEDISWSNGWSNRLSHVVVDLLLEAGADANMENDEGRTPIHQCLKLNRLKNLDLLVQKGGADLNRRDANGFTPLMALVRGDYSSGRNVIDGQLILCLLDYRPDCSLSNAEGDSALHIALRARELHELDVGQVEEIVAALLACGADPNHRNHAGKTPLHEFCIRIDCDSGNSEGAGGHELDSRRRIISTMVGAGANLEAKDWDNRTILFDMVTRELAIIQALLDLGCDIHTRDYHGRSLLHELVKQTPLVGNQTNKTVQFLVSRGLDPSITDYAGNTLLHELAATHAVDRCPDLLALLRTLILPDQGNHIGRTPLHVAAGIVMDRGYNSRMSLNDPLFDDSFDLILQTCNDRNAVDKDLMTPLHLAAMDNEYYFLRLLETGVDPFKATGGGLTVLHIASRDRQSNIVGLICEYSNEKVPLTAKRFINARDHKGWTALHYASSSGRPETVEILLRNGADPNAQDKDGISPLIACKDFEKEQARWMGRGSEHDIARLEEIVNALIAHGADPSLTIGRSQDVLDYVCSIALRQEHEYTYALFLKLRARLGMKELEPSYKEGSLSFSSLWSRYRFDCAQQAYDDCKKPNSDGDLAWSCGSFVEELLSKRQFHLVRRFMSTADEEALGYCRTMLVKGGHADLLHESFQQQPPASEKMSGITRNALSYLSLLLEACKRTLPNTAVLKCLIRQDDWLADTPLNDGQIDSCKRVSGDTALHVLARGEHWWQVAEGIPCLLDAGADINARDEQSQTPLHVALSYIPTKSSSGQYRKCGSYARQAAKLLIARGADVNINSSSKRSCLVMTGDQEIIEKMLESGAKHSISALFRALVDGNAEVLETLLHAGFDPNEKVKRGDSDMEWLFPDPLGHLEPEGEIGPIMTGRSPDYSTGAGDVYPLLYASSRRVYDDAAYKIAPTSWNETQLVRTLLKYGADPSLIVAKPAPRLKDPTLNLLGANGADLTNQSIVHAVIYDGGCSEPLLELPGLDLEARDERGMTLFLSACCARIRQDRVSKYRFSPHYERDDDQPKPVPVALQLIGRGADIHARDVNGNSALHLLAAFLYRNTTHLEVMDLLLGKSPSLVHAVNGSGDTPWHSALRSGNLEAIEKMLDAGADVKQLDSSGNNALHYLSRTGQLINLLVPNRISRLVRRVLDLGIDINSCDAGGETMLHHVVKRRDLDEYVEKVGGDGRKVFDGLVEAGADVFARDSSGDTLLHVIAAREEDKGAGLDRSVGLFVYLMELGLDPLAENDQDRTSIDVAVANGRSEILKLFEDGPERDGR